MPPLNELRVCPEKPGDLHVVISVSLDAPARAAAARGWLWIAPKRLGGARASLEHARALDSVDPSLIHVDPPESLVLLREQRVECALLARCCWLLGIAARPLSRGDEILEVALP